MAKTKRRQRRLQQRLFGTTKDKLLALICFGRRTVEELATELAVTDNAIRAQLQRLERDGLVSKRGLRPGVRRPHVEYELTSKARQLFPKAYEPVLRSLVDVLTEQLSAGASAQLLHEAGRRLLRERVGELHGGALRQRIAQLMERINGAGRGIELAEAPGKAVLRSCSCPLASVTAAHPELCALFANLIGDLLGAEVSERCKKGVSPRCHFEIAQARR
jgi:predicted ArsR family transcriptional regulator